MSKTKKSKKIVSPKRQFTRKEKKVEIKANNRFPLGKFLALFLVFAAAIFFRVYRITEIPPSLNWDEISHAYNAYSIFKTGKDEWGTNWPLIFRAYGDYKLPLYVYLTSPIVGLLGINLLTVRVISILSGIGLVLVTYLITKKISRSENISIFAAFLTAVSPWSLFVSRAALEANLAAFFFSLAIYFWLIWQGRFKAKDLAWSVFLFGLSLYSYNSARVLVPFFLVLTLAVVIKKKVSFKKVLVPFLLILVSLAPLVIQLLNKSAVARFDLVSLVDQGMVNQIILARSNSTWSPTITRVVYNRPVYFVFYALKNYLSNLSPYYLFFWGGNHYQFSLPDHELLYLVIAPFLLLGIIKAVFKGRSSERLVVFWFFLAFIPSAITKDAPHVLRTLLILPSPMILSALGLKTACDKIKSRSLFKGKFLIGVLSFAVLVSFGKWWLDYQNVYPKAYSWAWQQGYQEAVSFIKQNYSQYDHIFFTKRYGEPHEFILAYFPWDPAKYQSIQNKKWDYHANWFWVDGFDKFNFYNDWEFQNIQCPVGRCLLIASPENYPEGWNKIETINYLNEEIVFEILEN